MSKKKKKKKNKKKKKKKKHQKKKKATHTELREQGVKVTTEPKSERTSN